MALKKINIQECHRELIKIAAIFDQLCKSHDIPYYMLGGTMLGAIRHKGFIPWDDDMDFGIPRPYFLQFLQIAQKELPTDLAILTNKNSPAIKKGFIKIELKGSKLIERVFDKEQIDFYNGIAIDIFPLDGAETNKLKGKIHIKIAFFLLRIQEGRFCSLEIRKGVKKLFAYFIKKLPIDDKKLASFTDKYIQKIKYEASENIANFYGHWKEREIVPKYLFGQPTPYIFDTIVLNGVSQPDKYLKSLYNDYMKLPPLDKQLTHADEIYIEETTKDA